MLSPVGSYTVDILHNRSAEIMAANACVAFPSSESADYPQYSLHNSASRNLILSACIPMMLPLIKSVGAGWTNTIAAGAAWAGAVYVEFSLFFSLGV